MAKIPSKQLIEKSKQVEKAIQVANFDYLIKEIPEQIQRRTRLGKGVSVEGQNKKLDPLSDAYVKKREALKKKGDLFNETTPKRSNLTLTGQMLNAIIGFKESATRFVFTFNTQRDDGKSNLDIARWVQEKGRNFFRLSSSEMKQFERKVSKTINQAIKNLF